MPREYYRTKSPDNAAGGRAAESRWRTAIDMLRLLHTEPGITRAAASERLGISSASATETAGRLREMELIREERAPASGRGRPTTVLSPHDRGPLVCTVALRSSSWEIALADLGGEPVPLDSGSYGPRSLEEILPELAASIGAVAERYGRRVRCVAVTVAGTVTGTRIAQFSTRGWGASDLRPLMPATDAGSEIGMLGGNDATLSGLAEARTGVLKNTSCALHLLVEVGVGGTLVVNGDAIAGASGAAGEYGHLPLGDPALECPCGARGCWDLMVDGRAMARHLGRSRPEDPAGFAAEVLAAAGQKGTGAELDAVAAVAADLGAGVAALVNAYDPETISLAGLAPRIRALAPLAFREGFREGLMKLHRAQPPAVVDSRHADDGAVRGAAILGIDHLLRPEALERWGAAS
ncbi:ROK family transcriptional regulator [Sediminivirga luteola]|uniref:Xylose repressor n=1 Tax=Sediminivirga luteola TaxID=1774748 RepID=A0A8J2XKA9_9MICO|nr:ROK family transcriptional regulator [Sediminivirga luteola]MCI2266653.1 ROK family transcriptional regulator [Sediminivirga luteola]GGA12965.1 xylose repressor [Sediminivirga luteola]